MTVNDFCMKKTQAFQLCAIRDSGYIVETVWIDLEDIFRISEETRNEEVKDAEFGSLLIATPRGDRIEVPCMYIDI